MERPLLQRQNAKSMMHAYQRGLIVEALEIPDPKRQMKTQNHDPETKHQAQPFPSMHMTANSDLWV